RAPNHVRAARRHDRGRDRAPGGRRALALPRRAGARRAGDVVRARPRARVERRRRARHPRGGLGPERHRAHARLPARRAVRSVEKPLRRRRRLAAAVLAAAATLAVVAFPFRATWWGGWILAIAEAGIVGGLADWFAVTAIFRRPLGLPIPHTGLIPANWELMAERVGTMVGSRVLTREYVAQEIARVASLLGLIDRERVVAALHAGLREVADDPTHPIRERLREAAAALPERLRTEAALAARVEAAKRELLSTPGAVRVLEDAAVALHRALVADLARGRSDVVAWVAERLDRARHALADDAGLRGEIDRWVKARTLEVVERNHGRLAEFIEKGVLALGPEGAVRLIEEHAGDDLQFIRVNGTVVGGLAGGLLYAIHLL